MGAFQATPKYLAIVVLLFVFACHEVVLTHGRQIKATSHHSSLDKHTSINGNVPTSAKKIVHSPTIPIPNIHVAAAGFEDTIAEYTNAFRPTTPGNSPGIGHRKFGEDNENREAKVVVQSPDVQYSLTDTRPGHSPGVGHKTFGEDDEDIKANVVVQSPHVEHYSQTFQGFKAEFKPTKPGHGPGVGHVFHKKTTKINGELTHVEA